MEARRSGAAIRQHKTAQTAASLTASMTAWLPALTTKVENIRTKKCFLFTSVSVLFLLLTWYSLKDRPWHPGIQSCLTVSSSCLGTNSCKATQLYSLNDVTFGSCVDKCRVSHVGFLKDVMLERMIYDKPDALKPSRTDVLMVTPWLAPIVWNQGFNRDILNAQYHKAGIRVGITIFAIKKYVRFVKQFLETGEKFFMVGHKVNYYIFTDRPKDIANITLAEGRNAIILEVPAYQRWQDVTMRRMEMIRDYTINRFINEVDYLWCVDVDMTFLDSVGVEILGTVLGTLHPGFFGASRAEFTYERRPESRAYIPVELGDFYYAGGSFGGVLEEVIKLTNFCHNAMLEDKQKNMEALWHDESYLNKYFLIHKPTKVLSPEYIWNDYYGSPAAVQIKRFRGIDKDYNEIRFKRAISKR